MSEDRVRVNPWDRHQMSLAQAVFEAVIGYEGHPRERHATKADDEWLPPGFRQACLDIEAGWRAAMDERSAEWKRRRETCRHEGTLGGACYDDDCLICSYCQTHVHAPGRWVPAANGGMKRVYDLTGVTGSEPA